MHAETLPKPDLYQRSRGQPEDDAQLPDLADEYKAHGTPANHEIADLALVFGKEGFKAGGVAYMTFQYVHLSRCEFGYTADGQAMRLYFADLEPRCVEARGRNLKRLFHQISRRRVPWIRQADRDFRAPPGGAAEPAIILALTVAAWEPEKKAGMGVPPALLAALARMAGEKE